MGGPQNYNAFAVRKRLFGLAIPVEFIILRNTVSFL